MRIVKRDSFFASGDATAEMFVPQHNGQIVCRCMWYTAPDAGTIVIYRASQTVTANAAVAASATLVVDTTALGYVGGAVLTTNDFLLVESSASGWQYRSIGTVGTVSSSTVSLILGATISCAAKENIHIVRAADVVTLDVAAATVKDLRYVWNGIPNEPVYLLMTATGENRLSCAIDYEE